MLNKRFLVLILCFSYFLCLPVHAQKQTEVRLFLQENLDTQGRQIPLEPKLVEILAYFERETKLKFEPVILPWKRAQVETLDGKGIIYGFSLSKERLLAYHFSKPVITEKVWGITYGAPKPVFKKLEDLRGKTVSIGRGFSHGMEFDEARDVLFSVQETSASTSARFKMLMAKRSDLMLWPVRQFETSRQVENYVNNRLIAESGDPLLVNQHFDVSAQPIFYDTVHFASAKGRFEDVIEKLNRAIDYGTKSGALKKVLKGYH